MFEAETYGKAFVLAGMIFIAGNVLQALHHHSQLAALTAQQDKAAVIDALGHPADIFPCHAGGNVPELFSDVNLCQGKAYEVYSFPHCQVTFICPGMNYVVFDPSGHVFTTYRIAPPFLS